MKKISMDLSDWQQRRLPENKHRRNDQRSPFQRDRARILHSAAFRRLQAKTQVLGVGMNDFYRTRLTHSLETSQIGTGITAQLQGKYPDFIPLLNSSSLIESLCLAHDIGHPPFGHGGEIALNYMMRQHGGFEGNGQTFRILTKLEPYTQDSGMNLSRRTLLGILKYPVTASVLTKSVQRPPELQNRPTDWIPAKAVYDDDKAILDWVLAPLSEKEIHLFSTTTSSQNEQPDKSRYKSFDATIMELADDIAYAVHDLEDAIVMGIVSRDLWLIEIQPLIEQSGDNWIKTELAQIEAQLFSSSHYLRKDAIGTLVNSFVTAIQIDENDEFEHPLLRYHACLEIEFAVLLSALKQFVYQHVIRKPEVQMLEFKGQKMLMQLFEAFASDPLRLLPLNTQQRYRESEQQGKNCMRVIADYLSGMTDDFAVRMYQQLFSPHMGSIKDCYLD